MVGMLVDVIGLMILLMAMPIVKKVVVTVPTVSMRLDSGHALFANHSEWQE